MRNAMDIKLLSIDKIGLSTRSSNCLHRSGIHTVGDMLGCTDESLAQIRNLGAKSIVEIKQKIEEYRNADSNGAVPACEPVSQRSVSIPEDFDVWLSDTANQKIVKDWLKDKSIRVVVLKPLSARSYNLLMFAGYSQVHQVAFLSEDELMKIPRMETGCASEIERTTAKYIRGLKDEFFSYLGQTESVPAEPKSITDYLRFNEYRYRIQQYVKTNDVDIRAMGFTNRTQGALLAAGYLNLSDIVLLDNTDLLKLPRLGAGSVAEILAKINSYLMDNESRIMAYLNGDMEALYDDGSIRKSILDLYGEAGFRGLSLDDFVTMLNLPEIITTDRIKKNIGKLIADKKLEYVDYRCYRVYVKFPDYIETCDVIDDRSREVFRRRLQGQTFQEVGDALGITRERIRQIVEKDSKKIYSDYVIKTGMKYFDEDYYRYLISTYELDKKDGSEWLGIPSYVWNYLEIFDVKRGRKDLDDALMDLDGLGAGMRLKIKNYLNRKKIYIDGMWIDKKRSDLEPLIVRKYCQDNVSFDDFCNIYNAFLEQEEIPYDEDIYYTDAVKRTRENKLAGSNFLLWKLNKQIRYYDIDGRDFTELLDVLNLDSYENIELSTAKFIRDYPEIMSKYDIRDQYELHNLLRKIIPEGSYHDFHCGRMPDIEFGKFDRDAAMMSILMESAPISKNDLAELISGIYGYDPLVVAGNYLECIKQYYHDGVYSVDYKQMSEQDLHTLHDALTEDFYFIGEIKTIFENLFPDADPELVNPYNLKMMGFYVYSGYVIQNYSTADSYFYNQLTKDDIVDIAIMKKRYSSIQAFWAVLADLKHRLEVIEFMPNQIINFRKLDQSGITRDMIREFCDQIYDAVSDGEYFSARSLRLSGFESDLYSLGFEDWFYANLLLSDERFSAGNMFGNMILYKGQAGITIKSFLLNLINTHGSVDALDLLDELTDKFGCRVNGRSDITAKIHDTPVYYDKVLDRLFADKDMYYSYLERGEF